ncbi:syndapin isoform c [Anaeramoeba flamelloides]|uniref:Syndapin isoform c n=1 Tax=Anaeramoeba flamelloides TaxID=1746091 RepID=A0AAV8A8T6_9EUKA|nr:syndapin isoform c [Anaeramoeba flamelloides]
MSKTEQKKSTTQPTKEQNNITKNESFFPNLWDKPESFNAHSNESILNMKEMFTVFTNLQNITNKHSLQLEKLTKSFQQSQIDTSEVSKSKTFKKSELYFNSLENLEELKKKSPNQVTKMKHKVKTNQRDYKQLYKEYQTAWKQLEKYSNRVKPKLEEILKSLEILERNRIDFLQKNWTMFLITLQIINTTTKDNCSKLVNRINLIQPKAEINNFVNRHKNSPEEIQDIPITKYINELQHYNSKQVKIAKEKWKKRLGSKLTMITTETKTKKEKKITKTTEPAPLPPSMKIHQAVYSYIGDEDNFELSFNSGDLIYVLEENENNWWKGQIGKKIGYFPLTYTRTIKKLGIENLKYKTDNSTNSQFNKNSNNNSNNFKQNIDDDDDFEVIEITDELKDIANKERKQEEDQIKEEDQKNEDLKKQNEEIDNDEENEEIGNDEENGEIEEERIDEDIEEELIDDESDEQSNEEETTSEEEELFYVMSLYDYEGEDEEVLCIHEGEKLIVLEEFDGWIKAQNELGDIGLVPENYTTTEFED